jgi:hypothetical protein
MIDITRMKRLPAACLSANGAGRDGMDVCGFIIGDDPQV